MTLFDEVVKDCNKNKCDVKHFTKTINVWLASAKNGLEYANMVEFIVEWITERMLYDALDIYPASKAAKLASDWARQVYKDIDYACEEREYEIVENLVQLGAEYLAVDAKAFFAEVDGGVAGEYFVGTVN